MNLNLPVSYHLEQMDIQGADKDGYDPLQDFVQLLFVQLCEHLREGLELSCLCYRPLPLNNRDLRVKLIQQLFQLDE